MEVSLSETSDLVLNETSFRGRVIRKQASVAENISDRRQSASRIIIVDYLQRAATEWKLAGRISFDETLGFLPWVRVSEIGDLIALGDCSRRCDCTVWAPRISGRRVGGTKKP